jgi:hypothetical protein
MVTAREQQLSCIDTGMQLAVVCGTATLGFFFFFVVLLWQIHTCLNSRNARAN